MRLLKCSLILFISLLSCQAEAQYYYTDIINTRQTNEFYKSIAAFSIKKVVANSYDNNEQSKDFYLEQRVSKDGSTITTHSQTATNAESYMISYYQTNRVIRTVDSGTNAINTISYDYGKTGRITTISSTSKDFDGTFSNTETHNWIYNDKGIPEKMLRIKNGVDTTNVVFSYDDEGILAEEKWVKRGRTIETYYYYYNSRKQLTDVVRYNSKAKKLLPDFMFEYDNAGHVIQMTQTQAGTAGYLVWKYQFNDRGLKEREIVYNKQKQLLGKIEFTYE